jgi:hypothetical protein
VRLESAYWYEKVLIKFNLFLYTRRKIWQLVPFSEKIALQLDAAPYPWIDDFIAVSENRRVRLWACGAAGSALPWHGRGRRFDPDQVHHLNLSAINHFQSISDLLNQAPKLRQANSKAAFQPFARKLIHTLPA